MVQRRPGGSLSGAASPELPRSSPPVNYAPVFFPGTANVAQAISIKLAPGEERTGVDVQFNLVPTARIDGTCTLPEVVPPQSIVVTLAFSGSPIDMQIGIPRPQTSRLTPEGRYTFAAVTPGKYTLTAKTAEQTPGRGRGATGPPDRTATIAPVWYGMAELDVDGQDLDVPLDLQPAMTISGRLVFEGTLPRPDDFTGVRGFLIPPNAGGNLGAGPPGGQADTEGRFAFSGVTPGSYRVFWTGAPRPVGWSVKSAVALGVDVLDTPLEVRSGMTTIELIVTYTDRPTRIEGTLQDSSGRPATDYFIVVFTTDRAKWGARLRRVQSTRPASDGTYSVYVAAGEYYVAALTDLDTAETSNPAFLEQLIPGAIKVVIAEGESKKQDIKIAGR
jgi:hypothetical protein